MRRIRGFPVFAAFLLITLALLLLGPAMLEFESAEELKRAWRDRRIDLAFGCIGAGFTFLLTYLLWELSREYAAKRDRLLKRTDDADDAT